MKHKILALVAFVTLGLVFVFWGVAGAQSFRSGATAKVGKGEVVDTTLWAAGQTVEIAGRVNGDVFCAGQTVTISGTVDGDVLCAAQNMTISGTVRGDIRAVGQSVIVSAQGVRNLTVASQSFVQEGRSTVQADATIAASDISMNGKVGRDAAMAAATIRLGGPIGRNVSATVNQLRLDRGAQIKGDLSYTSNNNAQIAEGASVSGKTTKSKPAAKQKAKPMAGSAFGSLLYLFAAGLFLALVLVFLFPQAFQAVTNRGVRSPLKALLTGVVAGVVVPLLILFLLLTLIGIPLAIVLGLAWALTLALAGVASAYYLGRLVLRNRTNPVLIMLLGAILLLILYIIPLVGFIAFVLAMIMGIGMLLLALADRWPRPSYALASGQPTKEPVVEESPKPKSNGSKSNGNGNGNGRRRRSS